MLLMGLSREWLLLSAVLKHETLQKPLSTFIGMKVGPSRLWDSVGTGKVVASLPVVGLAFVLVSTRYYP